MPSNFRYILRVYEDSSPWSRSAIIKNGDSLVHLEEALEIFDEYRYKNPDFHGFYSIEIIDVRVAD